MLCWKVARQLARECIKIFTSGRIVDMHSGHAQWTSIFRCLHYSLAVWRCDCSWCEEPFKVYFAENLNALLIMMRAISHLSRKVPRRFQSCAFAVTHCGFASHSVAEQCRSSPLFDIALLKRDENVQEGCFLPDPMHCIFQTHPPMRRHIVGMPSRGGAKESQAPLHIITHSVSSRNIL